VEYVTIQDSNVYKVAIKVTSILKDLLLQRNWIGNSKLLDLVLQVGGFCSKIKLLCYAPILPINMLGI